MQHVENSIILVNKPKGISSNAVLTKVKKTLNIKKAGHTGTLDPLATGMLPICLGEATKFSRFFIQADKAYRVIGKLGIQTDTGDCTGEVKKSVEWDKFSYITQADIINAMESFNGEILQVPPMYSALKHNGKRLYKYARQGVDIERKARKVVIHDIKLNKFNKCDTEKEIQFELEIICSKGTYIRTIVTDLGAKLGCGACVFELDRLWVAPFNDQSKLNLTDLGDSLLIDQTIQIKDALIKLGNLKFIDLNASEAQRLINGLCVEPPTDLNLEPDEHLAVTFQDKFIGIAALNSSNQLKPVRLMSVAV